MNGGGNVPMSAKVCNCVTRGVDGTRVGISGDRKTVERNTGGEQEVFFL